MRQTNEWLAKVQKNGAPIYLAILAAMEDAIRGGELQPGDRLPPQRQVAAALGVDITTVTRAFNSARERGLVQGEVGRGTYVTDKPADDQPLVDLSMNLPPAPDGVSLAELLRDTTTAILQRADAVRLMAYHSGVGSRQQQAAGAKWLAPVLGQVEAERVLVTPGAQTALAAIVSMICKPGDQIVVEPLTYPGFIRIAAQLGVSLIPCATDDEGFQVEELGRICREMGPKAIYIVPTLQNPTAVTTTLQRRQAIADLASQLGIWIIEDDPYSRLLPTPLPAIASLAPDRTFHVATLSKCLTPGLRIAYVAAPPGWPSGSLPDSLRNLALMPPPLMTAIATSWIREGFAEALLGGIRREAAARRQLARTILPAAFAETNESIHVWLDLPSEWPASRLQRAAEDRGLSLVAADAFATSERHRDGVRISLGAPQTREILASALETIRDILAREPKRGAVV